MRVLGPSAQAFESLAPQQRSFLRSLPKVELHAHLNGCIPLDCLIALAHDAPGGISGTKIASVQEGLRVLKAGSIDTLQKFEDAFDLFPAIYHITSTPRAVALATSAVLDSFLESSPQGDPPQCTYIELRTTPRSSPYMSRKEYLSVVLDEVVKREDKAALIVSVDRRMTLQDATECVELAIHFRNSGQPVVAMDLCGLPFAGDMNVFSGLMKNAQDAGLLLTTHIAETERNTVQDTAEILSWNPQRLGHATFLDSEAISKVSREKIAIEICLSSNLLTRTAESLSAHHLHTWLGLDHPIVLCTDDTLPFDTNLVAEYALLLASPPLGLGFGEDTVRRIAEGGFKCRFPRK